MNALKIENTAKTPGVDFTYASGELNITGISVPEDSLEFYTPILNWLNEFSKKPPKKATFNFKLSYVNTSSLPLLYDILLILDSIYDTAEVKVNWYYIDGDDDLKELGEDLQDALKIHFSFIEVDPDELD